MGLQPRACYSFRKKSFGRKIKEDIFKKNNLFENLMPAKTEEKEATRIRIKIKAYDNKVIDQSAKKIIDAALVSGAKITGPVPLPTEIHKVTVNKSTFVHKDSRDQYEMRVHKRLVDIWNPTPKTVEDLTNLDLPAGVDIEIKM